MYSGSRHIVLRGKRLLDDQAVILKTPLEKEPTPGQLNRLRNEFRLLRSYKISGLVEALTLEQDNQSIALVLQDAGKQTLQNLIGTGPLSREQFLEMAIMLAQAASNIHGAGLIHRDLCPSNIVLDHNGKMTIVDLETAIPAQSGGARLKLVSPNKVEGTLP